VTNLETFVANIKVTDTLGNEYTEVSSDPGNGQYTCNAGVYVFGGRIGLLNSLEITYSYGNPYHYALTELERGMYGTTIAAHNSGALFARLDSAVFEYDLPNQYVGVPLYIKLVSFNPFGLGAESIADVSPIVYTPIGTGIPSGVVKAGTYTATSADATAGSMTIPTGLASVEVFTAPVYRGTVVVTGDAKESSSGANIIVADGPSVYVVTAGDEVKWFATGAIQLAALLDTSGHVITDTSGNTIFTA
jgi:hypothetical protein